MWVNHEKIKVAGCSTDIQNGIFLIKVKIIIAELGHLLAKTSNITYYCALKYTLL
jgi:hypothetical protein